MSAAFSSPFMLLLPLVESPGWLLWVAAAASAVSSAGEVIYNVTQVSFRQAITPDQLLGRMNASIRFLVWGTMPLGGLAGAWLGGWLGARQTMLVGLLGTCVAFLPVSSPAALDALAAAAGRRSGRGGDKPRGRMTAPSTVARTPVERGADRPHRWVRPAGAQDR